MAHTPYGYKIQGGKAALDLVEATQLKKLFNLYLSGLSMNAASEKSGIKCYHARVAKMLTNKTYLGNEYYPQLIDKDIFEQAGAEKVKRAKKLGRIREYKLKEEGVKKYKFAIPTPKQLYEDPFKQAEYAYSLIESEVVGDGTK